MSDYEVFLDRKRQLSQGDGFAPTWLPDFLFDFQSALVDWALRRGRAAIFADCGLGKTPMQLVWAENVVRHTRRPVLILTPLAVGAQTVREGAKFGIECRRDCTDPYGGSIIVTNYERLHKCNPADFSGVVCDESSILKSFDGERRAAITEFMRRIRYRLLCTATAAPNDYTELGTSSEALGYLGHVDMLNRFFVNQNQTSDTKGRWRGHGAPRRWEGKLWRFKGHAEEPFWRWVCSWARAIRRPSDLGFADTAFTLPPLIEREHVVAGRSLPDGMLFALPATSLQEQRDERRRTLPERCEAVADLVAHDRPALVWCHLNAEADRLERMIPGAIQVSGNDDDDVKEERLLAFIDRKARVLITKPRIGGWGLNFQHCDHVTFFPSHSYEQFYQCVRRCWRFGQQRPVTVDLVTTEGEQGIMANLQRKSVAADRMFTQLTVYMKRHLNMERSLVFHEQERIPEWL